MKSSRPMRSRKAAKRVDLTDLRHLLKDARLWTGIGIVPEPENGAQHWRIETDDAGEHVDILVDIELQPEGIPVSARIAAGVWAVPAIGEEVAVIIPAGRVDFMPTIVALLSSNAVPSSGGQGPTPDRIVLVRSQVLVHDGAGGAVSLSLKSDSEGVDNKYKDHLHLDSAGSPTSGPLKTVVPNLPNPSFPTPDSVHPFLDEHGTPTTAPYHAGEGLDDAGIQGTSVLLGK